MTLDFAVHQFWATSFYAFPWQEHFREAPGIVSYLYQLRDRQRVNIASGVAPGAKSGYGIYESEFDLLKLDHPGLVKLREFITRCVQQAAAHANGSEVEPGSIDVEICDSWYHITNAGGYHDAHVHGGCSWCGIYYLRIGESGQRTQGGAPNGGSRFYSPLWRGGGHLDYGNDYLGRAYIDPPIQDGLVLLFPSYLLHAGLPYQGKEDRIVIAFNTRSYLQ